MAASSSEGSNVAICTQDAKEEILDECENIWKEMEEHHKKLKLLEKERRLQPAAKLSILKTQTNALAVEYKQWQDRSPEIISTNPEVLSALGEEELQRVKNDLESMLSTVMLQNEHLEEDLKREQQWYKEQEDILHTLNNIEEDTENQVGQPSVTSLNAKTFKELQSKMLKLQEHKEELLNALSEILENYFPHPVSPKKENSSVKPTVELITLHEILEILVNKLISIPHEPYITINDSFWPPYIEMLLRFGIALRHPEDPKRIRLEAFHQ